MSVFPVTVGLAFTKNRVKRRSRVSDLQHTGAVHIGRLLSCRCDLHLACFVRCTDTTRQVQVALLAAIDAHSIMDASHMPAVDNATAGVPESLPGNESSCKRCTGKHHEGTHTCGKRRSRPHDAASASRPARRLRSCHGSSTLTAEDNRLHQGMERHLPRVRFAATSH